MNKIQLAAIGALSIGAFNSLALAHDERDDDHHRSERKEERHSKDRKDDRRDYERHREGEREERHERREREYRRYDDDDRRFRVPSVTFFLDRSPW